MSSSEMAPASPEQPPVAPEPEPAALGVDVGTTATRASLAPLSLRGTANEPYIVDRPEQTQYRERFGFGDFPSAARFFAVNESPLACIGYIADDPDQIPVKMFMYIVRIRSLRQIGSDKARELVGDYLEKIPQLDTFFTRFDNLGLAMQRRVLEHAQLIFLTHLRQVRERSEEKAQIKMVKITKLAATIPPNWDRWTQKFYILLLTQVWNYLGGDDIFLMLESEAVGHWLLRLDHKTLTSKPKKLILADFGGHTLSSNVFEINYRDDGTEHFFFFSPSVANCSHAGSELHASSVKNRIRNDISKGKIRVNKQDEPYLYKTLMDDYRNNKRTHLDDKAFWIDGRISPKQRAGIVEVAFHDDEAHALYSRCFDRPLADLYTLFKKNRVTTKDGTAVNNTDDNETPEDKTVVVLTGGTFSNECVMKRTKTKITAAKLKLLDWTNSAAVGGQPSSTVSVGAALAIVNNMSVKEFMSQAAFAVQAKTTGESTLPVIWNSSGTRTVTISLPGRQGDEVYISCCPLAPHDGALNVPIESTFEFQSLGKKYKGDHEISLEYREKGRSDDLSDRLIFNIKSSGRSESTERFEWPIYYDPGGRVCFIDIDKYNEKQGRGGKRPELIPKTRNRKGARTYLQWEQGRLDPSKPYWEDPMAESLDLPMPEEVGMGVPAQGNGAPAIQRADPDPTPGPSSSRSAKDGRARMPGNRPPPSGGNGISLRRNKKQAVRQASGRGRGKQIATRQNIPEPNPEPNSQPGFTNSSFAPVETEMEDDGTRRGQATSWRPRTSGESSMAAGCSHRVEDIAHPRLGASQARIEPTHSNSDITPSRNTNRAQGMADAGASQAAGFFTPPTYGSQNSSHHVMSTRSRTDPFRTYPDYIDGLPREDLESDTDAEYEAILAAAIQDSEEPGKYRGENDRGQLNMEDIQLNASTRTNSSPLAERSIRGIQAPFAPMSSNAQ